MNGGANITCKEEEKNKQHLQLTKPTTLNLCFRICDHLSHFRVCHRSTISNKIRGLENLNYKKNTLNHTVQELLHCEIKLGGNNLLRLNDANGHVRIALFAKQQRVVGNLKMQWLWFVLVKLDQMECFILDIIVMDDDGVEKVVNSVLSKRHIWLGATSISASRLEGHETWNSTLNMMFARL